MSPTSKLIDKLRAYANDRKGELAKLISDAADTIELLSAKLLASNMERSIQYYHGGWIPCSERMPECEQEVMICTKKKIYISKNLEREWYEEPIITPALYEDGTVLEVNSKWRWEDIDYAGWDKEEDCGIIPEGWWENRHFGPDGAYNSPIDKEVIAWMPLPEPYKEDTNG